MSLWTKSYDVAIQILALCLYFRMMLFVCQNFKNEIWKFGRNLHLATFGSERVNIRFQGPKIWNSIDDNIKSKLKQHYLLLAFLDTGQPRGNGHERDS